MCFDQNRIMNHIEACIAKWLLQHFVHLVTAFFASHNIGTSVLQSKLVQKFTHRHLEVKLKQSQAEIQHLAGLLQFQVGSNRVKDQSIFQEVLPGYVNRHGYDWGKHDPDAVETNLW